MTTKYTLPGVMQYLQSQFSQAERNRMQADLEKSSLKLKIIELEHERNALVRRNRLLESKLEQLGHPIESEDRAASLDDIESVDVDKLIKAKQFLKSATNEIIYLLKAPLVEIDEPIDATLFRNPSLPSRENNIGTVSTTDLGEPFKSIPDDGSDQDTIIDVSTDDDDDELSNIKYDNGDGVHSKRQKEKVINLLKKPLKSNIPTNVDIKLLEFSPSIELKSGNLLIKYEKSNSINVHSIKSNELICSVDLPIDIKHLKSNGDFIVFTTLNSLHVHPIRHSSRSISIDLESEVTQLDINNDSIVITTSTYIKLFCIDDDEIKTVTKHPLEEDIKDINEIKLIDHHPKYDLAILTANSILFFNIENGINGESLQMLNDIQLTNYKKWYLTPLNLIVQFEHGLYLMDLEDNSEFKNIPGVSPSNDFEIGSCFDDDSVFYIWQDSTVKVFQNTSIGTINKMKSFDGIQRKCCIGDALNNERLLLQVKDQKIILNHI